MAGSDPVDTHGHTVTIAQAQEPLLDPNAAEASRAYATNPPTGDSTTVILAQSAAEVNAQITNAVPAEES